MCVICAIRVQNNPPRWCEVPTSRRLSRQALPVRQVQPVRIRRTRHSLVRTKGFDRGRKRQKGVRTVLIAVASAKKASGRF